MDNKFYLLKNKEVICSSLYMDQYLLSCCCRVSLSIIVQLLLLSWLNSVGIFTHLFTFYTHFTPNLYTPSTQSHIVPQIALSWKGFWTKVVGDSLLHLEYLVSVVVRISSPYRSWFFFPISASLFLAFLPVLL
jgi:hypothetical protein